MVTGIIRIPWTINANAAPIDLSIRPFVSNSITSRTVSSNIPIPPGDDGTELTKFANDVTRLIPKNISK